MNKIALTQTVPSTVAHIDQNQNILKSHTS